MQNAPLADWELDGVEPEKLPFTAVLVYDDLAAGQNATQILSNLRQQFPDLEIEPRFWPFNLLAEPEWFAIALAESASADLIAIATNATGDLNPDVVRWIQSCLAQKQGTTAAVVALFGPEQDRDSLDSPRLRFIRQLTEKAGLQFFAPSPPDSGSRPAHFHRLAGTPIQIEETSWQSDEYPLGVRAICPAGERQMI